MNIIRKQAQLTSVSRQPQQKGRERVVIVAGRSSLELRRPLGELESSWAGRVGVNALRLTLVDVLQVDVGSEAEIVASLIPGHISRINPARVPVAMRLKIVSGADLRKPINKHEGPTDLPQVGALEPRNLQDCPAEVLGCPNRDIVEILAEVTKVGIQHKVWCGHVRSRNGALEEMALNKAGSGISPADRQSAERAKDSIGVCIMVQKAETVKRAPGELVVILAPPLVIGSRCRVVPAQSQRSRARLIRSPQSGLTKEFLYSNIDSIGRNEVVAKWRPAAAVRVAGGRIEDWRRGCRQIARLHSSGRNLYHLRDALGVAGALKAGEVEQFVFPDRSANRGAVLIVEILRIWLRAISRPLVGFQMLIGMILEQRAMQGIRPTLDLDADGSAAGQALFSVERVGYDIDLLNGLQPGDVSQSAVDDAAARCAVDASAVDVGRGAVGREVDGASGIGGERVPVLRRRNAGERHE